LWTSATALLSHGGQSGRRTELREDVASTDGSVSGFLESVSVIRMSGIVYSGVLTSVPSMAYDFAGSWDSHAGHQANLFPSRKEPRCTPFSASRAVDDYKAAGVPGHKIVLGMPLYGRAFQDTKGPGHSFSGVGEGSWENGVWDYKALPHANAKVEHDHEIVASWEFDKKSKMMVTYDTPEIAAHKVDYIAKNSLGGAMWWESSADKAGGESLICSVSVTLVGSAFLTNQYVRSLIVWVALLVSGWNTSRTLSSTPRRNTTI
jgi:GH18 family chitinase